MGRKPLGNYILLHISMIIPILGEKKEQATRMNPTISDPRSKSKPVFGKSLVQITELHPRVISSSCHWAHFDCSPAVSWAAPDICCYFSWAGAAPLTYHVYLVL